MSCSAGRTLGTKCSRSSPVSQWPSIARFGDRAVERGQQRKSSGEEQTEDFVAIAFFTVLYSLLIVIRIPLMHHRLHKDTMLFTIAVVLEGDRYLMLLSSSTISTFGPLCNFFTLSLCH